MICLFCSDENDKGFVRVYPGKLQLQIEDAFVNVPVDNDTTVSDLVRDALNRFGLQDNKIEDYRFVFLLRRRMYDTFHQKECAILKLFGFSV